MNVISEATGMQISELINESGISLSDDITSLYVSALSRGGVTLTDCMTCRDILRISGAGVDSSMGVHALLLLLFAVKNKGSLCLPLDTNTLKFEISGLFRGYRDVPGLTDAVIASCSAERIDDEPAFKKAGGPVIHSAGRLYFSRYFSHESGLKSHINALLAASPLPLFKSPSDLADIIGRASSAGIGQQRRDLNDEQKLALLLVLKNRFTVVSGGPGTGKTRLLASLLRALIHAGLGRDDILLIAPTGRAGKRMGESVAQALKEAVGFEDQAVLSSLAGITGSTVHSALGSNPTNKSFVFRQSNRLPYRVIVCDEVSMVDVVMMDALLDAVDDDARVVFLGDRHQLPSVEAGAVLGELVPSIAVPGFSAEVINLIQEIGIQPTGVRQGTGQMADRVVMLSRSYRSKGDVLVRAAAVNAGSGDAFALMPWISDGRSGPSMDALDWGDEGALCRGIAPLQSGSDSLMPVLRSWVSWLLSDFVRASGLTGPAALTKAVKEISAFEVGAELVDNQSEWLSRLFATVKRGQILCALREGPEGVAGINLAIAGILNSTMNSALDFRPSGRPGSAVTPGQAVRYFPGCPIMVTRNNRSLNLYNGDTGIVLRGVDGLVAVFEEAGAFRQFAVAELPETVPAFAITIHKSQGSEYENVLIVLPGQPDHPLMTREILYTAMTRTRNNAWFHARGTCLSAAVARCTRRYSGLDLWPEA